MAEVAVIQCRSYDPETVFKAVARGVKLLGGVTGFVQPGEKILLKPNLLVAVNPAQCVTTHPSIFRAVAELFQQAGAVLSFGDSPAVGSTGRAARKAGLLPIAEELGIKLADFKTGRKVSVQEAVQNKQFVIAQGALDCDGIISLPKLKTHMLERLTGCVKNQFGCVPGMRKGEFHVKLPDAHQFARMLVDLNNYLKPRLYVMDGVQAMEGNGPRSGKPRQMNVILLSSDPIALDATVCRLVNIAPEHVPTIKYGAKTGSGTYLEKEINLLGDDVDCLRCDAFDISREPIQAYHPERGLVTRFMSNRLVAKPVIDSGKCTKCGTCVAMCPVRPKALGWFQDNKDIPPVYDYDRCIRCYCCQEVCPDGAIRLKKPLLKKILPFAG